MKKNILVVCNLDEKAISLQQIPLKVRKLFVPAEGHTFLSLDFKQAEYRTLAALSKDKNMIDILNSDEDFYKVAGAKVLNKPYDEITSEDRDKIKVIFLGVMYDMSEYGVAKRLRISETEARNLINDWQKTFPQATKFKEEVKDYVRKTGRTPEYFGRYRDFGNPEYLSDTDIKEGFNTLIQSTTADLLKIAMVMTSRKVKEKDYGKMSLTLHDELLFEIKDDKLDEAKKDLAEVMQSSVRLSKDWPKFTLSVNTGKDWEEASK